MQVQPHFGRLATKNELPLFEDNKGKVGVNEPVNPELAFVINPLDVFTNTNKVVEDLKQAREATSPDKGSYFNSLVLFDASEGGFLNKQALKALNKHRIEPGKGGKNADGPFQILRSTEQDTVTLKDYAHLSDKQTLVRFETTRPE